MTTVEVLVGEDRDVRVVGQAHVTRARGQISTTFLYDSRYLADGGMNIDPALLLVAGSQHQAGLVRAFADSAPDRWGRNLIEKARVSGSAVCSFCGGSIGRVPVRVSATSAP